MHWAKGPAKKVKWTQEESRARDYSADEIEAIKKQAKRLAPNAVFHAQ